MILTGITRLGKDAELRYTPDNQAVMNVALAFNYGKKGEDGHRPTQWVDAALWGQRAEALQKYLVKGSTVSVVIEDPHIETFQRSGGEPGHKLVGKIISLEFAGGSGQQQRETSQPQQREPARQQRQSGSTQQRHPAGSSQPRSGGGGGNGTYAAGDFDDDIPFATASAECDPTLRRLNLIHRW